MTYASSRTWPKLSDDQRRKSALAKVHIAKKQLALSDEDYRAILREVCEVESSKGLSLGGLEQLLEHFKRVGFKAQPKADRPRKLADDAQSRKLRALWLDLADKGIVHNASEAALLAYVKRMTGSERLEWITSAQASRLIESLKQWNERVAKKGATT